MFFANIFSVLAAIAPTSDNGFWQAFINLFVGIGAGLVNGFYHVLKWLLAFVDFLQYFIQKLIGLDYWLEPGSKSIQGATENDLLFTFLYNETVQNVFRAMVGLFIVFLIVFTIFAIVRQEWKFVTGAEKDNSKNKIIGSSLKAIALVVVTPLILLIGIVSSNAILASIVKALNIDMSTSFGNTIFSTSSIAANRYRIYTDSGERMAVSSDVTFYIDSSGKQILFGSVDKTDNYSVTYSNFDTYLEQTKLGTKYTVDSMFRKVVPRSANNFYGFCISLRLNGSNQYYMVEVDVDETSSGDSVQKIKGMYHYLKNVLRADVMTKDDNIGSADIHKAVKGKMKNGLVAPGLIENLDINAETSNKLMDACYNTWYYHSVYRTTSPFEVTTSSTVINSGLLENSYKIVGQSSAKIIYNAYDYKNYFDGGQFGVLQLNAEYGVMSDVLDFICESGANLFVLDATSPLIDWNYDEYRVDSKWVANNSGIGNTVELADGNKYLPFVVDYSETAMSHEQGKTLYFAREGVGNELEGSKFIMCFKVNSSGGLRYIPLVHRKTYIDPVTQQSYYFKSDYLSNTYKGAVIAKGNFNTDYSNRDIGNGSPTYLKQGASISSGNGTIEYDGGPFYYDILKDKVLKQTAITNALSKDYVLEKVTFNNTDFNNLDLEFDLTNEVFSFVNTSTGDAADISNEMLKKLSLKLVFNGGASSESKLAEYLGVNDGKNYLYATSDGYVVAIYLNTKTTFTIKSVALDGSIGVDSSIPSSITVSEKNKITATKFSYSAGINYNGTDYFTGDDKIEINPQELILSKVLSDKYLFTEIDKRLIKINNEFEQNLQLNFYFNESSIYNINEGKVVMASPSGASYDLQMYKINLYDFMHGYVDSSDDSEDGVYRFDYLLNVTPAVSIDTYTFGIVIDEFNWGANSSEYNVYNGAAFVAKLIKANGESFVIDGTTDNLADDPKTVAIEINGNRYYNLKTQNKYATKDDLVKNYKIINESMFVGCYSDVARCGFTVALLDLRVAFGEAFRINASLITVDVEKEVLVDNSTTKGVFSLANGIEFDYFFEGETQLMWFYNVFKIQYWLILVASVLIIKTLGTAVWGVIKRFYEITLYYLALPVSASLIPIDNGSRFGKVQTALIQNVLGTYGVILGLNVFFVLLSPVKSMSNIFTDAEMASSTSYFLKHFPFSAKILNNYVYIMFVLVAFTMIDTLPSVINGLVGGKDVYGEGKTTKTKVGETVKSAGDMISGKAALDFGSKAIQTVGGAIPLSAPIKWGAGKFKDWRDNKKAKIKEGADAAQQNIGAGAENSRADGEDQETPEDPNSPNEGSPDGETPTTPSGENPTSTNSRADEGSDDETQDSESSTPNYEQEFNNAMTRQSFENDAEGEAAKAIRTVVNESETGNDAASRVASSIVGEDGTGLNAIVQQNQENGEGGLTTKDVIEIVRQLLGEQAEGMSDEELSQYDVKYNKDLLGNITGASLVKKTGEGDAATEEKVKDLSDEELDTVNREIVAKSSDKQVANGYNELSDEQKGEYENAATSLDIDFGNGELTGDDGASIDALKLTEMHKGDEAVENAVILEKLRKDPEAMSRFMQESGLDSSASDEDMVAVIGKMKNFDGVNAVKSVYAGMDGSIDSDYVKVVEAKFKSGEIKATAWDIASDADKERFVQEYNAKNYNLTDEEKQVERSMAVSEIKNSEEYLNRLFSEYVKSNSENVNQVINDMFKQYAGISSSEDSNYEAFLASLQLSDGVDFRQYARQGKSEEDIVAAYAKARMFGDLKADGTISQEKLDYYLNENDEEINAKIAEALSSSDSKYSISGGSSREEVLRDFANTKITEDEENAIVDGIVDNEGTQILRAKFGAEGASDEEITKATYEAVQKENERRKQTEQLFDSQGDMISAAQLNELKGDKKFKELYDSILDQVNEMLEKEGKEPASELTDDLLEKLKNSEENAGYDPDELVELKKALIRSQIDSGKEFSAVADVSSLSDEDKQTYEMQKLLLEEQINSKGGATTIANLFRNSEFVGKDQILAELASQGKDITKLSDTDIARAIDNNKSAKDALISIGATDVSKAFKPTEWRKKQEEIIKNDPVLSKMATGVHGAKLDKLIEGRGNNYTKAFASMLAQKMKDEINPTKHISAEERENFFAAKSIRDDAADESTPITMGVKKKKHYKVRKDLPTTHTKYNKWNEVIDKDIEAVKSGKGTYANLSKEERKAKIEELKARRIDSKRPDEYFSWSVDKQKAYDDSQNLLKNDALNSKFTEIKKKDYRRRKVGNKQTLFALSDLSGDRTGKFRALTGKNNNKKRKQRHKDALIEAEAKITRFNTTAPMRNKERDFGSNFEVFASAYISDKSIASIQKKVEEARKQAEKKGKTFKNEDAIKIREEEIAKALNKQYKVASNKVAKDNKIDKEEYLVERGVNAGSVRYKDGSKRYKQIKSRLGRRELKRVKAFEEAYANGEVDEKTRKKYMKTKFAKNSELAAIQLQNQQKTYDAVIAFNKSYKSSDGNYADLFKAKFGDEIYKKYNEMGIRNLEKSPAIVQQREILKRIERDMKKNLNRQKYSTYIPADDSIRDRFRKDSLKNAKTEALKDKDKEMANQFRNYLKQFTEMTKNGQQFDPDELAKIINPKKLGMEDFIGVDNELMRKKLEGLFEKYRRKVINNSYSPDQTKNLVKLNGTFISKAKVRNTRLSTTALQSLSASDADVYKNLVKNANNARTKVNAEQINLDKLKKALQDIESGIQTRAARKEAEKIRKAIQNSEIRLNNLKSHEKTEEARKKAFEQSIAGERIKQAVKQNAAQTKKSESDYRVKFKGPNGAVRYDDLSASQKRQVRQIMDEFNGRYRANLDHMLKTMQTQQNTLFNEKLQSAKKELNNKFLSNYRSLVEMQKQIKTELKSLVNKKDSKSRMAREELKISQSKLNTTLDELKKRLLDLGI